MSDMSSSGFLTKKTDLQLVDQIVQPIKGLFFCGKPLELSTHVLTLILEKSDFSRIIEDSWRKLLFLLTEIFFISWIEKRRPFSTVKMAKARALYLLNCIGHQSCQAVGIFVKGSMKDYGHTDPSSATTMYTV